MKINKKNRTELKHHFRKNEIPTEGQFAEFIDAGLVQAEDGIAKIQGNPLAIQAEGDAAGTQEVLGLFSNFNEENPTWSLNLNPRVNASLPDTNQNGLNIKDSSGQSRLFINSENGNVGLGTIEAESKLTILGGGSSASQIAVLSRSQLSNRIFEIFDESGHGRLSMRSQTKGEAVRLSTAVGKPSFLHSNLGIGTKDPDAELHIKKDTKASLLLDYGSDSNWELSGLATGLTIQHGSKSFNLKSNGDIVVQGGFILSGFARNAHTDANGAIYRKETDVYLSVKEDFYIRESEGSGNSRTFHFDAKKGRLAVGGDNPLAPLTIKGPGKESSPDASMHLTNRSILFGGANAGKHSESGRIVADDDNTLKVFGMSSNTSTSTRKVGIFAEGGLEIKGNTISNDNLQVKKKLTVDGDVTIGGSLVIQNGIKSPQDTVVAFSVGLGEHMNGKKNPLEFSRTIVNIGNHFKSNKHFIAPVKGFYSFTLSILGDTEANVVWVLRLNDNGFVDNDERNSKVLAREHDLTTSRTIMTILNEGDKVHVEQTAGGRAQRQASSFSGMLIQAFV